jgi:hypothetical protein
MTGTERKRAWRLAHPDESREYERRRAQARREGQWDRWAPQARACASSAGNFRRNMMSAPTGLGGIVVAGMVDSCVGLG